jgi:hypothetical protein
MSSRQHIVIECLHCGHCASMSESVLPDYGVRPDAPIASFIKRLTCIECGSGSVKAYRLNVEAIDVRND